MQSDNILAFSPVNGKLAGRSLVAPGTGLISWCTQVRCAEVTHIAQTANARYGKLVDSDEKAPGKCAKFAIKNLDICAPAGSSSHVQNSATLSAFPLDFSRITSLRSLANASTTHTSFALPPHRTASRRTISGRTRFGGSRSRRTGESINALFPQELGHVIPTNAVSIFHALPLNFVSDWIASYTVHGAGAIVLVNVMRIPCFGRRMTIGRASISWPGAS
jgi:hypothetical protein